MIARDAVEERQGRGATELHRGANHEVGAPRRGEAEQAGRQRGPAEDGIARTRSSARSVARPLVGTDASAARAASSGEGGAAAAGRLRAVVVLALARCQPSVSGGLDRGLRAELEPVAAVGPLHQPVVIDDVAGRAVDRAAQRGQSVEQPFDVRVIEIAAQLDRTVGEHRASPARAAATGRTARTPTPRGGARRPARSARFARRRGGGARGARARPGPSSPCPTVVHQPRARPVQVTGRARRSRAAASRRRRSARTRRGNLRPASRYRPGLSVASRSAPRTRRTSWSRGAPWSRRRRTARRPAARPASSGSRSAARSPRPPRSSRRPSACTRRGAGGLVDLGPPAAGQRLRVQHPEDAARAGTVGAGGACHMPSRSTEASPVPHAASARPARKGAEARRIPSS